MLLLNHQPSLKPWTLSLAFQRGFTMVELLSTLAILAVILAVALPWVGNYIATAKRTSDQLTLETLNDALTRYKTQGGLLSALTQSAPAQNILNALKQPLTWNGITHQVLQSSFTVPARSLTGAGNGKNYHFSSYASYTPTSSSPSQDISNPSSNYGLMSNTSGNYHIATIVLDESTTCVAFKSTEDTITIYDVTQDAGFLLDPGLPHSSAYKFWSCTSLTDSTPKGYISDLRINGGGEPASNLTSFDGNQLKNLVNLYLTFHNLTSVDLTGCTALEYLELSSNPALNTLNITGLSNLREVFLGETDLSSIDLSGLTSLLDIRFNNSFINTIDLSGAPNLEVIDLGDTPLVSISIPANSALNSLGLTNTQITSLDASNITAADAVITLENSLLTGEELDSLYTSLPQANGNSRLYVTNSVGVNDDTPSIATLKSWTVNGSD